VVYFDIRKQKMVWILKHKEQHKDAAGDALMMKAVKMKKGAWAWAWA
jgi:hypothetical protein